MSGPGNEIELGNRAPFHVAAASRRLDKKEEGYPLGTI